MLQSNDEQGPRRNWARRRYPHLTETPGREKRTQLILEAISNAETSACLVEIEGPCSNPTVQGHIIPKSRLDKIEQGGEVIVAELPPITYLPRIGEYQYQLTFRPVNPDVATTDWFSCHPHDRGIFQSAEQDEIDWQSSTKSIMKNLALFSYKAVLSAYARQDRNARIWENLAAAIDPGDPELLPQNALNMSRWERTDANRTKKAKDILEWMVRNQDYDHMTHIVVQTGPTPLLAANTFFHLAYNLAEDPAAYLGPIGHAPQFITAYPSPNGQTMIRSWITPNCPHLTILDADPNNAPERHVQAQALSILLLEQSEVIAISPRVWKAYGEVKQRVIREHFQKTVPYSESPIQSVEQYPEPQLLNLFNTTPLVI